MPRVIDNIDQCQLPILRGRPRIANRLLRRVRDYADMRADGNATRKVKELWNE